MGDEAPPPFGGVAATMNEHDAAVPGEILDAHRAEAILTQGIEGYRLGTSVAANEALLAGRVVRTAHAHELAFVVGSHKHAAVVEIDRQCVDGLRMALVVRAFDPAQPQRRAGRAFQDHRLGRGGSGRSGRAQAGAALARK